ncbi:DUF6691 family protein [Leclercia adecarboxylata]|uniref:YeeE/YedE family protein n=1 Tax=Leclercia adecarboxylata TaxID=83655 RepID=A0A855EKX9_9ENTR|nr:DUF6691 family protein [Leclercia adecarboxylata]KFC89278.1 hypothetical protein GLAD_04559 [Leclercia adecarboxylata ATCC 23216 = NBRC 102595]PHH04187.1 hypothetical protein CRX53_09490 [Leclercia adecarboxylata]UBH69206.1 YeeE/YedE family protein [Leclercia adecarboxylata]SPX63635.1 Predicted transporter component [Leclercia adecarboxylata]STX26952.1 Predicted transporter component [Leclercia adecarboxylata]
MLVIFAFLCGLIFGVGLLISGMANPDKVLGFLDLSRPWDPSLAFVMIGAIAVGIVGFALVKGKKRAFCGVPILLPANNTLDRTLVVGAILFGLGWGLAGICPGPALVLLGAGVGKGLLFILAMLVGMWLVNRVRPS